MKQFSLLLNIILLAAVGVLFYFHFSGNKPAVKEKVATVDGKPIKDISLCRDMLVAFVEMDSVKNNVSFLKEKKKELEDEQKRIDQETDYQYKLLTKERDDFIKRGNSITQKELEEFQIKLSTNQQAIEQKKQANLQRLSERGARIIEDMQNQLKSFMKEYNKDKRYTYILATGTGLDYLLYRDSTLNITSDIVKGLNDKMKEKAGK